jgi:hypothetical protein
MSTIYPHTSKDHSKTWRLAAVGALVLLLAGGGAAAYWAYAGSSQTAATSAAAEIAAGRTPTVALGIVSGAAGVPVEAPIRVTGAYGVGSIGLSLSYDPAVVTVVGLRNGVVPQSQLTWRADAAGGVIVMLLTTSLPKGIAADATLATLVLEAKEGAVGTVSPLTLALRSAASSDGHTVTVGTTSGSFRNGVPGDVTGDGAVDRVDYDRLARYLVGEDVPIVMLNADLDADGKVTDADAVRLHQYLDAHAGAS